MIRSTLRLNRDTLQDYVESFCIHKNLNVVFQLLFIIITFKQKPFCVNHELCNLIESSVYVLQLPVDGYNQLGNKLEYNLANNTLLLLSSLAILLRFTLFSPSFRCEQITIALQTRTKNLKHIIFISFDSNFYDFHKYVW